MRSVDPAPGVPWIRAVTTRAPEPSLIPMTLGAEEEAYAWARWGPREGAEPAGAQAIKRGGVYLADSQTLEAGSWAWSGKT